MAFYPFDPTTELGAVQRQGLDSLRDGLYKLAHVVGNLNQMTAAQAQVAFGYPDLTTATNAMAEMQADVNRLINDTSGVYAGLTQMLNQFG